MADPPAFGGIDFWLYRITVTLAAVLWTDFFRLQQASSSVFIAFNALIVALGFSIAEVAAHVLDTAPPTARLGSRPVRMPQFDTYAIAFYLAITLANGLLYKTRWQFSWWRVIYIVITVGLTPIGLRRIVAFSLGEMYLSALLGTMAGLLVYTYLAFIFARLSDVYELERDWAVMDAVGVRRVKD